MNWIFSSIFLECLRKFHNISLYENLIFVKRKLFFRQALINPFGFYINEQQKTNLKFIIDFVKSIQYISTVVVENPFLKFSNEENMLLQNAGFYKIPTFTHILDLKNSFNETIKSASKRKRLELKKYKSCDFNKLFILKPDGVLEDFYLLYKTAAKERWKMKKNIHSKEFLKCLSALQQFKIFSIYSILTKRTVGAVIFLEDKNKKCSFYWLGAFDIPLTKELRQITKLDPSSLLWAYIIDFYIKKKYKYINLGSSFNLDGVKEFKERLGGQIKNYNLWLKKLF